jgi:hypothetical protein
MRKIITLSLSLLLVCVSASAQSVARRLELSGRTLELEPNKTLLVSGVNDKLKTAASVQVYLSFNTAPDKARLKAAGITLQHSIQQNVYVALVAPKADPAVLQSTVIDGWAFVLPADKINPELAADNSSAETVLDLLISVKKGLTRAEVDKILTPFGARLTAAQPWSSQEIWEAEVIHNKVNELASEPLVVSLTPKFSPVTFVQQAMGFTNTQGAHSPLAIGGHNLHGDNVTIGVGDDSDPDHIDYVDRLRTFNPVLGSAHGFHTTGTVGGDGIKDERYKGFSNRASLISDFFSQIIANGALYNDDFHMVVSSNSYGNIVGSCSYAGTYDIYAQFVDQLAMDKPKLLNVFAAANDGGLTCSPYPAGYATVTGSFSSAKNALTVANMGKTLQIVNFFTSKGPVKDGRLKPEIAGVGMNLISTMDLNNYAPSTGTSMACPNVAGGAGLLYQRYRQLHSNDDPQGALVKALLMNGAYDLGTAGPDFVYGFGLMNIGHSLTMLDSNRYFTGNINTNQEQTFTFDVPANTSKAKVMLYWNDPAAGPLSTHTLINDLDLTVIAPSTLVVTKPLVLDTLPSQILLPAVQGVDRINNVEQVTLNNPAAGTYTIKLKGFNVPEINQEYFVAYDFLPVGLELQYPFGNEVVVSGEEMIIYWAASPGTELFTVSYSTDNGANWIVINNSVAADLRSLNWTPPVAISSNQCLVRVTRGAVTVQSKAFTLNQRPVATLNPTAEQCPGAIKMNWNAIPGASGYHIFKKIGDAMVDIATVSGTTYTYTGLSPDTTYWVAVAPVINGTVGMRCVALNRMPSDGNCVGAADGDLRMAKILAPGSGRLLTSTALSASQPLTVVISNLDDQAAANYKISYRVNAGPWLSNNFTDIINPAGNRQLTITNLNLAAAGVYNITVAVTNLAVTDPVSGNDTMSVTVKQVANPVMNVNGGYLENFETTGNIDILGKSFLGIDGIEKWDFTQSKQYGHLRNYINSEISIEGTKSMSLDNAKNQRYDIPGSSYNTLTGTFNLSSYTPTGAEVRCEFDYVMSGIPKFDTGNSVWVRGSDIDPWIHVLDYQIDTANLGVTYNSGTISLSDLLNNAGQNFSSSTQVRFTQYDTSRISATYFGNGVTMDNFKLYTVTDDVALLSIDSVYHYNCGLSNAVPMKIKVRNGVNNTVHNIAVYYQLNNQPVVSGLIDSIPGKDTVEYTFAQPMDLSANTTYTLSSWIYVATDTYRLNDSIMGMQLRNQPVITTFPYLQNFESGENFFFAEGNNSSWEFGTPASNKINHAASGTKAWKTRLEGNYNNLEYSYLYSPCFDISQLSNPRLSFSLATDIEDPGTSVFDMGFVEYSHDGYNWQRLGAAGQGTNWYTNDSVQAWTKTGEDYWHVATIALPKDGDIVSFRFVLKSDQGAGFEGIAIDDIHVYDLVNPIFDQEKFSSPITQNINAGQTVPYLSGNNIGATLIAGTSALGNTTVQDYKHTDYVNADSTQYFLPKNFTIQTANSPSDSVTIRFYVPDEGMRLIREDTGCYSCNKVREVQGLGISKYDDPDKNVENNTMADNLNGSWSFIPKNKITWVPYDIGYYAIVKVKSFSEFWFNDGGPTHDQTLNQNLFDFTASHYGSRYAQLNWTSYLDAQTVKYELQRADASMNFAAINTVNAVGQNGHNYTYIDTPVLTSPVVHYRIKYTMNDGSEHLSLIRSLDWSGTDAVVQVYPNPVRNGVLNLEWFKGNGEPLKWGMYSIVGQRVTTGETEENVYNGKHTFDLSTMGLSSGMYILKVISGNDKWEFKIVYQ